MVYYYDTNPLNGTFSQNAWGRLTAVVFQNEFPGESPYQEAFAYEYSYNQAGRVTAQRLTVAPGQPRPPVDLDALYEWDNEGRMTKLTYPGGDLVHNYGFDSMGRLNKLNGATIAVYGVAGELTSFNGDTRTYNSLFQLTRINAGTSMDIEYNYTAGSNNGRITSSLDHVTGENVTYTYDGLNRLTKAATADNLWGTTYGYDGWGNLLSKSVFKGTAPTYSTTIDPATNGGPGQEAAPGSWTYDVERRMLGANGIPYSSYDPNGKRIFQKSPNWQNPGTRTACEVYFYAITGQKLATYGCHYNDDGDGDGSFNIGLNSRNEYFGGNPLKLNGVAVVTDRLGSVRWNGNGERFNYYPYGEEPGTTANGREKFGTYFRDANGLDYADQRYYDSTKGRFTTVDPLGANGSDSTTPQSLNLLSYAQGDPVNLSDPTGLITFANGATASCGALTINGGKFDGETVTQVMRGTSGEDLMAQLMWHEDGSIGNEDLADSAAYYQDMTALGTAILNQVDVDNDVIELYDSHGRVCPLGHCGSRDMKKILTETTFASDKRGQVFSADGSMRTPERTTLNGILDTNAAARPTVLDHGIPTNLGCEGVLSAIRITSGLLDGTISRINPDGLVLLYWNKLSATTNRSLPGYSGWRSDRSVGHTFWGLRQTPAPPRPRPIKKSPR